MKKSIAAAWTVIVLIFALRVFGIVSNTWIVIGLLLLVIAYSRLMTQYPKAGHIIHACFWIVAVVLIFLSVAPRFPFTVAMMDTALTDRDLANGAKISRFSELRQDLMAKLGGLEGFLTVQEIRDVNIAKKLFERGGISEDSLLAVYSRVAEKATARSGKIKKVAALLLEPESGEVGLALKPAVTVTYVTKDPERRNVLSFPTRLKKDGWCEEINLLTLTKPIRAHYYVYVYDDVVIRFRDGFQDTLHAGSNAKFGDRSPVFKLLALRDTTTAIPTVWD